MIATESESGTTDPIPRIQFIHPFSVVRYGTTKLSDGHVAALSWGDGNVNVVLQRWCCPESIELISIDPASQKVRSSKRLASSLLQAGRIGSTLVLLAAPPRGLGTATLVVVAPDGGVRSVALDRIVAGRTLPAEGEDEPDLKKFRQSVPGLAIDPEAARAFVVPASGVVAEVALGSLAVSYHDVAQTVSLLGRAHNWLEPKASAKGLNGPMRTARWLGSGVVAVTGGDEAMFKGENGDPRMTWTPAGLRLIDTNSWGSKLIDPGADSFAFGPNMLLATGSRWDSSAGAAKGMGFAAYGLDGTRKLSVLGGRPVSIALAFRARAYLADGNSKALKVVDLATGKLMKDRAAPLAQLLIGDGST